jgi:hypothetical protein
LEIRFGTEGGTTPARTACEELARHGEPSVSLYWSLKVPVRLFVSPDTDLLATTREPGPHRVPLLKLASTLKYAAGHGVGGRVELDFGGTIASMVTYERIAGGKVRLENEDSGVQVEISAEEFDRGVQAFHAAVAGLLREGCPALLDAAIAKGWLHPANP